MVYYVTLLMWRVLESFVLIECYIVCNFWERKSKLLTFFTIQVTAFACCDCLVSVFFTFSRIFMQGVYAMMWILRFLLQPCIPYPRQLSYDKVILERNLVTVTTSLMQFSDCFSFCNELLAYWQTPSLPQLFGCYSNQGIIK